MNADYEREGVRLYLGDCRDILPTLDKVDALITDPPYGVGLTKKSNDFRDSSCFDSGESLRASVVYHDSESYVVELIDSVIKPLVSQTRAAIFCGHRLMFSYPKPSSIGTAYVPNGAGRDSWGFGCNNPILFYGKCPYLATGRGGRPNSFTDNQPGEYGIDHPCPKPISWMQWLVSRASLPGETILDPFMGSGTTGVAAVRLGRKFVGIEMEPKYFDIAVRRVDAAFDETSLLDYATEQEQMEIAQ